MSDQVTNLLKWLLLVLAGSLLLYLGMTLFVPMLFGLLVAFVMYPSCLVIGVFAFVQYLEANVIFPKVVGSQVNLSTWATLVSVIAGGIIWGISGMILFIPVVAILKIAAQHIPGWEPLYLLLKRENESGDTIQI